MLNHCSLYLDTICDHFINIRNTRLRGLVEKEFSLLWTMDSSSICPDAADFCRRQEQNFELSIFFKYRIKRIMRPLASVILSTSSSSPLESRASELNELSSRTRNKLSTWKQNAQKLGVDTKKLAKLYFHLYMYVSQWSQYQRTFINWLIDMLLYVSMTIK